MTRRGMLLVAIAAALLICTHAGAWMRVSYSDVEVTTRSELIVVGHLDKDSLRYVSHGRGQSWEHRATLIVTEVLKGTLKDKKVEIVINYGLDPFVDGHRLSNDANALPKGGDPNAPGRINIEDTGDESRDGDPVLADAQEDNLWCLRHLGGDLGREAGKGELGVVDPEDLQRLKYKEYFQALLAPDMDKRFDRLLADKDRQVVARVVGGIGQLHRRQDGPRVADLLTRVDGNLLIVVARTMAEVGDQSVIEPFRKALASDDPAIRAEAVIFLCRFRDAESIPAIAKVVPLLPPSQREEVLKYLPRMQSRQFVGVLLDQLDEQPQPDRSYYGGYECSVAAAEALKVLTEAQFPLDSRQGRQIWDKIKNLDGETLLRKARLEDIERMTDENNSQGKRQERIESQKLLRAWADKNLLRSRVEWVYEDLAASGIELPKPMDANGIDTLIQVLDFYGRRSQDCDANAYPAWKRDGGWPQADSQRYNANLLLEWCTGHTVGLDPRWHDLQDLPWRYDGLSNRWAEWWKENRGKAKLLPAPALAAVTADMISAAPSLRLGPPPLTLTIRGQEKADPQNDPLAISCEVKNTSPEDVTVERAIYGVDYASSCGGGFVSHGGHWPLTQDDFVVLKPGQSTTWNFTGPNTPKVTYLKPLTGIRYELTYRFAGSEFGLRSWRGVLRFNTLDANTP